MNIPTWTENVWVTLINLFAGGSVRIATMLSKNGLSTNKCDHLHTWQDMIDCRDSYLVEVYCEVCNEKIYEYVLKKEVLH